MKRSKAHDLPSQEVSSKMSRPDLEAIEETPLPTTNIFLVEPVLRRLFKQIESVSMLKDLRKRCQLWDRVDTEELEERAFKGLFKPINLTFFNEVRREFNPIKASISDMRGFLNDTFSNPRLFRSFTIVFPNSLALLNLYKFRWFYTEYSPTILELIIPTTFQFNQDKEGLLKELLHWAAPTLRGFSIRNIFAHASDQSHTRKSLPIHHFNFPFLRKVDMHIFGEWHGIVEAFKVIFTKENHPETPSLTSLKLRYGYPLELLDLILNPHWATLTMLEIKCDNYHHQSLSSLANGLLSLARAGMTLKKLHLVLYLEKNKWDGEDPHILGTFRNLSQFFASQAGSLEALKLTFNLTLKVTIEEDQLDLEQIKIFLPVFERLHTLYLDLETLVYTNDTFTRNIIEFSSIPQHFPALENLNIVKFFALTNGFLGSPDEEEKRLNLKRIAIPNGVYWGNDMDLCKNLGIGSVEAFTCYQYALNDLRILGDLVDTIRVLHIRDVNSELNLTNFKGLRRVVIEEDDKARSVKKPILKLIRHKDLYLGYFKKVAELGLDSIIFRGLEMVEGESYKKFADAFPFRVEFEDKPVDWIELEFFNNYITILNDNCI